MTKGQIKPKAVWTRFLLSPLSGTKGQQDNRMSLVQDKKITSRYVPRHFQFFVTRIGQYVAPVQSFGNPTLNPTKEILLMYVLLSLLQHFFHSCLALLTTKLAKEMPNKIPLGIMYYFIIEEISHNCIQSSIT